MDHDTDDMRTTTVRAPGREVVLRTVEAVGQADAVAVIAPAMGVPARFYDTLARAVSASGRHVVVVEFPGQGDSPVQLRPDTAIGYQDLVDGEVTSAMAFAAQQWPDLARVLVGHSLGGQVSLLYAASHPEDVAAIALPAAGTIHWRAYEGVAGPVILAITQAARLVATVRGVFPGDRLGFGGRQPARLIGDWARTGLTGRWEPSGSSVDHHALLAEVQLPILSLTMDGDTFAPASAAAALVGLAPAADVRTVTVASDQVGRRAHFAWLRDPDLVVGELSTWLADIAPGW